MAGGTWDPTKELPIRPGVYMRLIDAADEQIIGGVRGIVAMPFVNYTNAQPNVVYEFSSGRDVSQQFGNNSALNPVRLALRGGAKKVIAYAARNSILGSQAQIDEMMDTLASRDPDVFVFPDAMWTEGFVRNRILSHLKKHRENGSYYIFVISKEEDVIIERNTASVAEKEQAFSAYTSDDFLVHLGNGAVIDGLCSDRHQFTAYVAGLIASVPLTKSITYMKVPSSTLTEEFNRTEMIHYLQQGYLLLDYKRQQIKIEKGITTTGKNLRSVKTKQAIAMDVRRFVVSKLIGKLNNDTDGQLALKSAIQAYLERYEQFGVLKDAEVLIDDDYNNDPNIEADTVYIKISYTEIESMERIFLTVTI
ncbi:phage tail sheath C-terminal domain-containing protein [Longirhabdus pacifica]|uniref:phage tail sheath C-terminal domain-containing protein n=1 Tax=Longirhabdus pacifica TaxID=2305227 RepID=UPI0013E89BFD|nr:phage tail sheath C-terminal domain-containing protein [Longirhabdus pacifica]